MLTENPRTKHLKVMSYNIKCLPFSSLSYINRIITFLYSSDADIIALQECFFMYNFTLLNKIIKLCKDKNLNYRIGIDNCKFKLCFSGLVTLCKFPITESSFFPWIYLVEKDFRSLKSIITIEL